ncbi:MAG: hypothetical protein SOU07_04810, partial [Bacilli bacterium]|nr:hypothetical protein [Bacilli bacterium]
MKRGLVELFFVFLVSLFSVFFACNSSTPKEPNEPEEETTIISFLEKEYVLERFTGNTIKINYSGDDNIVYSTSDDDIVRVYQDGVVFGIGVGNAVITASVGDEKATCNVTVTSTINYPTLNVSQEDVDMLVGDTKDINAEVLYRMMPIFDQRFVEISFKSEDDSVFTVDDNGMIEGVSIGKKNLTVTALYGKEILEKSITVNVKENCYTEVNLREVNLYTLSLDENYETEKEIIATFFENGMATTNTFVYESEDINIAEVDVNGKIKAKNYGQTVVKVKTVSNYGTEVESIINVSVEIPIIEKDEILEIEITDSDYQIDLTEFAKYFNGVISAVEVKEDNELINNQISNNIVSLQNDDLHYGKSIINVNVDDKLIIKYPSEIITKI